MRRRFGRNQDGSVLVETTVMITVLFILVLGGVDFLLAFYQWNAASKAAQMGSRIAAVSEPVAQGFNALSANVVSTGGLSPGASMPSFAVACDGSTKTCTCTGTCTGLGATPTFDSLAMAKLVYGRAATSKTTSCGTPSSVYFAGMCNVLSTVTPANVVVEYIQTGMGYAGRPDGPVPTVRVSLKNMPFQFYFLGGLLGFSNFNVPAMATTITGESLSSAAQCFDGPC